MRIEFYDKKCVISFLMMLQNVTVLPFICDRYLFVHQARDYQSRSSVPLILFLYRRGKQKLEEKREKHNKAAIIHNEQINGAEPIVPTVVVSNTIIITIHTLLHHFISIQTRKEKK